MLSSTTAADTVVAITDSDDGHGRHRFPAACGELLSDSDMAAGEAHEVSSLLSGALLVVSVVGFSTVGNECRLRRGLRQPRPVPILQGPGNQK